ncbi:MAG: hypothetical protein MHPSP_004909, partial [Paramarteilia canceri]
MTEREVFDSLIGPEKEVNELLQLVSSSEIDGRLEYLVKSIISTLKQTMTSLTELKRQSRRVQQSFDEREHALTLRLESAVREKDELKTKYQNNYKSKQDLEYE